MLRRFLLAALPLAVIIGLPLLFRKPAEAIDVTADQLVIVSPHNEAIRYEFEQAFREHYLRLTGRKVCIDWRATGGTSEIARYVSSAFTANFRHYWTHELKRDWNEEVEQAFMNKRLKPGDPGYEARKAFLESDVGIDIDLFFGGGQYDLSNQAAMGTLVPCGVRERHPEWFSGENPVLIQAKGGETWYDKGDCYYGACFSSFGICQNLDRLAALGYDMPAEGGGPLRSWTDLADGRLYGQLGLAPPRAAPSPNASSCSSRSRCMTAWRGWRRSWPPANCPRQRRWTRRGRMP